MKKDTIFWDVDTQYDFMVPEGKLYVAGAETIIEKVSDVRRFALENGYSIVADIDWHTTDNPEISDTPDFEKTFPPHCMAGEPGSDRVGYLGNLPVEYVGTDRIESDALKELVDKDQFHIVIRKTSIDVFENPNADKLLEVIAPKMVIVFGVALDFCVYYVLQGLGRFKDVKLCLLEDVVKGLGVRADDETFDEFRQMGVEITGLSSVMRQLRCG